MNRFIDVPGASGALYRFRLWPDGVPHPPVAGNYVIIESHAEGSKVVLVGALNDLSKARAAASAVHAQGPSHIFTRLNVGRAEREAEHADVSAAHPAARATEGVD